MDMRTTPPILLLALGLLFQCASADATVGLAEWRLPTPGGNFISHEDPYKEAHGTCLLALGATGTEARVLVSQLEWWQYYRGHVAGKSPEGYFLLDEKTLGLTRYPAEKDLKRDLRRLGLGDPASERLKPEDGWTLAWAPVFEKQCGKLKRNDPEFSGLSESQKADMRKLCDRMTGK